MKFPAAVFLVLAAAPAAADERRYTVTDFDRIRIDGPFRVEVTGGTAAKVAGIGTREALDRVAVDVEGRLLRIRTDRQNWKGAGSPGPVTLRVSVHQLRGLTLAGAARADVRGVKGLRFDLSLSGSGHANVEGIAADRLLVNLLGSGSATLSGQAKVLEASVAGTAALDAGALQAEAVKIASTSAGDVAANARRSANLSGGGSGDIHVSGKPACTVAAEGAGSVTCGD